MSCSKVGNDAVHVPVMVEEVLRFLEPKPGGLYIDATVGLAGHAERILERSQPSGRLIGIDRDDDVLRMARSRLKTYGDRAVLVHADFDRIAEVVEDHGGERADGILADLGVSSLQLDQGDRGFSFNRDGPLDMRMDRSRGVSATEFLAQVDEGELADIIYRYGEERFARRIARKICQARTTRSIETTSDLAQLVVDAVPRGRGKIHPATRTFQAIRIYVNDEMGMLERFLGVAPKLLERGGVLVVISYHSLEDRLVKRAFREGAASGWKNLTRKVVTPADEEIEKNARARSAKLRALQLPY